MRQLLAAFALFAVLAAPVLAQTEADTDATLDLEMGDHVPFRAAFDAIKAAVAADDAAALAAYIPLGEAIMVDGESRVFETEDEFAAAYDELFTPEIVAAVEAQSYATLFVNSEGVMFGDGQLWINGLCNDAACNSFDVKIIALQSTAE